MCENGVSMFETLIDPDREEKPTRWIKPVKMEDDAFMYICELSPSEIAE